MDLVSLFCFLLFFFPFPRVTKIKKIVLLITYIADITQKKIRYIKYILKIK